tara:strand:- start:1455 stop:1913 length:459 start_codon:yes stop_codon:yes gene_type:complete
MELQFRNNRITRERILGSIEGLTFDQITKTPEGYNNSILWNFCHVAVTQHLLCFKLAGRDSIIPATLIEVYRKGTGSADIKTPKEDFEYFKSNYFKLIDLTEEEYKAGKLNEFNEYPTSYGVVLKNIEEAICFNNIHEGLHLGYLMAQKKLI